MYLYGIPYNFLQDQQIVHKFLGLFYIIRLTPLSRPNKVGLKYLSVLSSVRKKFIWFQWNLVCR